MGDSGPRDRQCLERLPTGRNTQRAKQALHMRATRVLREEEPLRDLVRCQVLVEQEQDLEFARRQGRGDLVRDAGRPAAVLPYLLEQTARDGPGERRLTVR